MWLLVVGGRLLEKPINYQPKTINFLRYFNLVYDFIDDVNRSDVFGFGFIGNSNSMTQYIVNHCANVFRNYITTAFDKSITFCCIGQIDTSTRRRSKTD